ncbi:hypothetical protein ACFWVM_31290 [Nocardia fluminea]|uniref:hypothetical protein n=1 Tax=Nocardia fluminea TaxID=134984 RepID=UPI00364D8004
MTKHEPRPRSRRSPALRTEIAASRTHGRWPTTVMVVALAALSFWSLHTALDAGEGLQDATASSIALLVCLGQVCGLGVQAPVSVRRSEGQNLGSQRQR